MPQIQTYPALLQAALALTDQILLNDSSGPNTTKNMTIEELNKQYLTVLSFAAATVGAFTYTQSSTPSATVADETWLKTDTGEVFKATAPGTGSWVLQYQLSLVTGPGDFVKQIKVSDLSSSAFVAERTGATAGRYAMAAKSTGDWGLYDELNALYMMNALKSSGKLQFPNGILFGNDTADANTLDDYEEKGTHIVNISQGITTPTYVTQSGNYHKIGNKVLYHGIIEISAGTTTASGLEISIPFTSANITNGFSIGSCYGVNISGNGNDIFCRIDPSSSVMKFFYRTPTNVSLFSGNDASNNFAMVFTIEFQT